MKHVQKAISLLLVLTMLLGIASVGITAVGAVDETIISGSCGPSATYTYSTATKILTISGTGPMTEYTQNIQGSTNTPWYEQKFYRDVKAIVINYGITTIGSYAFYNMVSCTSVSIPNSVNNIGVMAFGSNIALERVTIPDSVHIIQHHAFFNCPKIASGRLSSYPSTTSIGEGNEDLITGSPHSTSIVTTASGTCGKAPYQNRVTWSFSAQSGALMIDVASLGSTTAYDMADYTAQTGAGSAPWSEYASQIQSISISAGVGSIGDNAFALTSNLKNVTIGSDVKKIGANAFLACVLLNAVHLPSSTVTIGSNAFSGCIRITAASTPNAKELMTIYNGNDPLTSKLTYGGSSGGGSDPATTVNNTGTLPNGVKWVWVASSKILSFSYNGGTGALPIPDYTSLSARPWHYLSNVVEKVFISTGISGVGAQALAEMPNLSTVLFDSTSLTSIGEAAFRNDVSIQTVTLPKETVLIYANAFSGCTGITAASTPNTRAQMTILSGNEPLTSKLTYAGGTTTDPIPGTTTGGTLASGLYWSFDSSTGEMLIYGSGAVPSYSSLALTDRPWHNFMSQIKKLTVSSGVTSIGDYAFYMANNLKNVHLAASVAEIGTSAFNYCPYDITASSGRASGTLTFATGNDTIQSRMTYSASDPVTNPTNGYFGNGLYWTYDSATGNIIITGSGTMPSYSAATLASRPWNAYITNIRSVSISGTIANVGAYAFYNATSLASVNLSESVRTIGEYAFWGCLTNVNATSDATSGSVAFAIGNETIQSRMTYSASGSVTNPTNGYFGNGLYWAYDSASGTINITGNGTMPSYSAATLASRPWNAYIANIRNIFIFGTISNVGAYAFYNATSLASVSLSESVLNIDDYAFWGCTANVNATSAATSGSVTFAVGNETIQSRMTYTGSSVDPGDIEITGAIPDTNITWSYNKTTHALNLKGTGVIPDYTNVTATPWAAYISEITCVSVQTGITAIGNYAFSDISGLVDAFIAGTVTTIGQSAFRNCSNLTNLELPSGLLSIGDYAFAGCQSLRSVSLPATLTTLSSNAFRECQTLQSITIPAGVSHIGEYAFWGCTSLKSLTLNEGLLTIGDHAFTNGTAIVTMVLPSTLTQIGEEAFSGCTAMTEIAIKSLRQLLVKEGAFYGCSSLSNAVYYYDKPETEARNEPLENALAGRYQSGTASDGIAWSVDRVEGILTLTYNGDPLGDGTVTTTNVWKDELPYIHTLIFGEGITGIAANLLNGDRNIVHLILQNGVTSIGNSAFESCTNLKDVQFPSNLLTLGSRAFSGCSSLEAIQLPDSLTQISDDAFSACTSLTSALLPAALKSIGNRAFQNCISLSSMIIPSTTEAIGSNAFSSCSSLTSVSLPHKNLPPLTVNLFNACSALRTVYFSGSGDDWSRMSANADTEIKNAQVIYSVTLTVHYLYTDGTVAAPSRTCTVPAGELAIIDSPVISNYTASQATVKEELKANREVIVYYSPKTYVLTVYYEDINGNPLLASTQHSIVYGGSLSVPAPTIKGYTPQISSVSISNMTGDVKAIIRYDRNPYTVMLQFRDTDGNPLYVLNADGTTSLYPDQIHSVKYNESLTVTLPSIKGYTPVETTHTIDHVTQDQIVTLRYTPDRAQLTVHYVDEKGNKLAEDVINTFAYGDKVNILSPTVTGYIPELAAITLDHYSGQEEYTVTYRLRDITVTVKYVEVNSNGYKMLSTTTTTVKYGSSFTPTIPDIEGYVADGKDLTVENVTEDLTITVEYTRAFLGLTVQYQDETGKVVGILNLSLQAGSAYDVALTAPSGYRLSQSHLKGTMGTREETIVVDVTSIAGYRFTLTIQYQDENGNALLADKIYQYAAGESYNIPLEKIKGYAADQTSVSGVMGKEDQVITITMIKKPIHKLTIEYVDPKGNVVETQEKEFTEGESYRFNAEELEGYTLKTTEIQGVMGTEDARVTVSVEKAGGSTAATIAIVSVVIVVVILGAGVAFYFCYLKKS